MAKLVGIIGGKGKMGRAFATFFRQHGFDVIISDKRTKLTNKKLVQKSDIVLVSVPITYTQKVLEEVVPMMRKNQTLIEITSVKGPFIQILSKCKGEVLSLHPMFNDTQFAAGNRILFMPLKGNKTAKLIKDLFIKARFKLEEIPIKKHDTLMSLIQGVPHFAEISFAHTMQSLGFKTKQLSRYASPATDLKLKMVGRILAQDSELYGAIQLDNPRNKELLKRHLESVQELYEIVQNHDFKGFKRYFASSAKFLGEYKEEALEETDHVLSILREEALHGAKNIEKKAKIKKTPSSKTLALLGPSHTYTDFAADKFLKKQKSLSKSYLKTIESVFKSVEKGKSKYGLIPIENRLHGTVRETLDGLFTYNVEVVAEVKLPIKHCLATLPGMNRKDIKIIMSHTQALNQCRSYLGKNFPKADHVAVSSSAKAFMNVENKNFRHIAVVGPPESAKHYGFTILDKNISNDLDNFTKFIVITKRTRTHKSLPQTPKNTSIAFYFSKDQSGSLLTVFQAFADHKVNMTKIESRPYKQDYGNYIFFIDFEGNLNQQKVKETLHEVKSLVSELKILGSY